MLPAAVPRVSSLEACKFQFRASGSIKLDQLSDLDFTIIPSLNQFPCDRYSTVPSVRLLYLHSIKHQVQIWKTRISKFPSVHLKMFFFNSRYRLFSGTVQCYKH
jgi:hypothetical protein